VDVKTVQELGGWKSISMVMRYAHVDSKRVMPALETLCATNSANEAQEAEKSVVDAVQ
jgi:site-specific recombinase XerD